MRVTLRRRILDQEAVQEQAQAPKAVGPVLVLTVAILRAVVLLRPQAADV